jgi:ABC-type amino acid transport substrate-binding protein
LVFAIGVFTTFGIVPALAQTLERVGTDKVFKIAYREDTPPFSSKGDEPEPVGYSVDLCREVALAAMGALELESIRIEFVPVDAESRFDVIAAGKADILCGATTATLERREAVSFSIPTFLTGVGALMRADAPPFLRQILAGERPSVPPRRLVLQAFADRKFGVRAGTTAETWLQQGLASLASRAEMVTLPSHDDGLQMLAERKIDAYFADRAIIAGLLSGHPSPETFEIADRLFTYEPYALALGRGDEDFRLLVDRTLSQLNRSGDIGVVFEKHFGARSPAVEALLLMSSLPE